MRMAMGCMAVLVLAGCGAEPQEGSGESAPAVEQAIAPAAAKGCGRGVRACSAGQVGQACDPRDPAIVCSAQANGKYCCLAYAP